MTDAKVRKVFDEVFNIISSHDDQPCAACLAAIKDALEFHASRSPVVLPPYDDLEGILLRIADKDHARMFYDSLKHMTERLNQSRCVTWLSEVEFIEQYRQKSGEGLYSWLRARMTRNAKDDE